MLSTIRVIAAIAIGVASSVASVVAAISISSRLTIAIFTLIPIHWPRCNSRLVHGHLILCLVALVVLRSYGWDEVHEEGQHEEGVDESDDPFQNGGCVISACGVAGAECCGMLALGPCRRATLHDLPIARAISMRMKASLTQNDIRKTLCWR
jgi:hypothetical protein